MKTPMHLFLICALALMLLSPCGHAEIIKKGQVGFRFLENPVSAEAIGRGGLGLVALRNSNTLFWNPAGLGWIEEKYDFNINYTRGIADINHSALAGAIRLGSFGVIGLDALIMDYGDFYGTRRAANELGFEETGAFSPQSFAIGLAFSQRVSDRFSYGVHVKYAHQDLGSAWVGVTGTDVDDPNMSMEEKSYALSEPAVDIGAIYDFRLYNIRFGAAMQNFSREIKYEEEKFPLPYAVSFSLSFDPLSIWLGEQDEHQMTAGFETRHPRDFKEKAKYGIEYAYRQQFLLRAGYMGNYDQRGLTLGFGVRQSLGDSKLRIDYAFQDFGLFKSVHSFSFGVSY